MRDPQEYNVRAVERAVQILNCFDDEHVERGVSEIALATGLHKATTHRIMVTLLSSGYLERTVDGQKYRLGVQLADIGSKVIRRMDVRREALPYMTQLVEQWDETCDLGLFDQGQVFYIEVIRGSHALGIAAAVGQRLPAHCTASGKLFLAHLPPGWLDALLSQPLTPYTDSTITSIRVLRHQLETIRREGYGFDDEEYEAGIRAVSAPIWSHEGRILAAMSIPGPTSRMAPDRMTEIAGALKVAARAVSRRLGWNPDL